jgi:hypothetical protein
MKKQLFTIIAFVGITVVSNAQNVAIPDANFKAYLVGNSSINTNADTEIQIGEAQAFTGEVNCSNMNITDLTGIEEFTEITNLNCSDNQLTNLDVSSNLMLSYLIVFNNSLTSVNVTQNTALTRFWCMFNDISNLDLSQNSGLVFLQANNNLLTSLNIANGNNTNVIACITNNNSLTCITVDNAAYSTTNWTGNDFNKDAGTSYSESCSGTAGIEQNDLESTFNIFPNPTSRTISIQLESQTNLVILSSEGKTVATLSGASNYNFDASQLENGIYYIQAENGTTQKFIKN